MAEFMELLETFRAEEATAARVYAGDGRSVGANRQRDPRYLAKLAEAAQLMAHACNGGSRRDVQRFQEAATTSDFPLLMGDILDRQLLAGYQAAPSVWRNFMKVGRLRDFRTVDRFTVDGATGPLSVVAQQDQYPERALSEARFQYNLQKYGALFAISWEAMINDDLDAIKDMPQRFLTAALRTESRLATGLYVGSAGPSSTLYTSGHANIVTGNPILSIASLQAGLTLMSRQLDTDGEPIVNTAIELVVPPALEYVAENILHATQISVTTVGGLSGADASAEQRLFVNNWMSNRFHLSVDPYIPILATTNGDTSWFLVASPSNGRPAFEMGFLRGHEAPEIWMKSPNATRVGGAPVDAMSGDFETDSIQYRVRHVLGGTALTYQSTVASNGSGS